MGEQLASEHDCRDRRKEKGNIIEEIVAALHESDEFLVERGAMLPAHEDPARRREIDVLITADVAGYSVRLAFECKNHGRRITVQTVDGFYGKLMDVGIPPQHGILVGSHIGFTEQALRRANELQMRTRVLEGITRDRMEAEIHEALQSSVYLLLQITSITVTSDRESGDAETLLFLRDRDGNLQGGLPDLVWADWRDGLIPEELDCYEMPLKIPKSWEWQQGGQTFSSKARAKFRVIAIVVSQRGKARRFALVDAESREVDRASLTAQFDQDENDLVVEVAQSEEQLEEITQLRTIAQVISGRIRMPRIQMLNKMYWPPSERVILSTLYAIHDAAKRGVPPESQSEQLNILSMEGNDLSTIWEPIWSEHPVASSQNWPWGRARRGKFRARKAPC